MQFVELIFPPSEIIIEDSACETCGISRCALGFIQSYASLISYESDLRIAKDANLVPEALEWPDWRRLVEELLTPTNKRKVNKRYVYGELRLSRLNDVRVHRYALDSPIRGYYCGYNSYHQFWDDNHTRIVALFAYIALALTAMQVELATKHLEPNNAFQRASYGFSLFSIIFSFRLYLSCHWSCYDHILVERVGDFELSSRKEACCCKFDIMLTTCNRQEYTSSLHISGSSIMSIMFINEPTLPPHHPTMHLPTYLPTYPPTSQPPHPSPPPTAYSLPSTLLHPSASNQPRTYIPPLHTHLQATSHHATALPNQSQSSHQQTIHT